MDKFLRPLGMYSMAALTGLADGLFNADINDPLFCFDGSSTYLEERGQAVYDRYL